MTTSRLTDTEEWGGLTSRSQGHTRTLSLSHSSDLSQQVGWGWHAQLLEEEGTWMLLMEN